MEDLLAEPGPEGTIVVSTQVVEAGVDVSAATLFTELAPWSSLVQRFGRCNRTGRDEDAHVYWLDLPSPKSKQVKTALPYDLDALSTARQLLISCEETGVGPRSLPTSALPFAHTHVIRQKDIVELFDTTPDLAGCDIDVSRFIREASDNDVSVFWRDIPPEGPTPDEPELLRDELCSAPIGDLRDILKKGAHAWVWDALEGNWTPLTASGVYPGIVVMLRAAEGRYTLSDGWTPQSKIAVPAVVATRPEVAHGYGGDWMSEKTWMTLAEHTDRVVEANHRLADALAIPEPWRSALLEAARWHDAGKAHPVFQQSMRGEASGAPPGILAKTVLRHIRHERPGFRHELASGILALMHGRDDLVAYLAASHHGKVRLSLRSLPTERKPPQHDRRFARGSGTPISFPPQSPASIWAAVWSWNRVPST